MDLKSCLSQKNLCRGEDKNSPLVFCTLSKGLAAKCAEIELESNAPAWTKEAFESEFFNDVARLYGVRTQGLLVGCSASHLVGSDAHLLKLGIRRDFRGRGIGKFFLGSILDALHREGADSVFLEVRASNLIARALYGTFGFMESGIRRKYYSDDGEDAVLMQLAMIDYLNRTPSVKR